MNNGLLPTGETGGNGIYVFPALIILAFVFFSNTFANGWTFDDLPVVVNNPDIKSLGNFFANSYPGRPLRELSLMLDHALFGENPAGYHFQNILWHAFNGCLVYLLARRLTLKLVPSLLAACLFILHPIQVEVVASASHRKDSLALFFVLLAVLLYRQALDTGIGDKWPWCLGAISSMALALFAKQNAIVLPMIFLLVEYVSGQEKYLCLKFKKALCFSGLLAGLGVLIWFFSIGGAQAHFQGVVNALMKFNYFPDWTESAYFMTVLKSWAFMFGKLFWPSNLALEYTFAVPQSWLDPWVVAGLLMAIFITGALCWLRRRDQIVFLGLGWFVVFWVPTANIWPLAYFAADRYLYAPSVGLAICAAAIIQRFWHYRRMVLPVACLMIVALGVLTFRQNQVWKDDLTLWSQAVQVSPTAPFALNNLGRAHLEAGDPQAALSFLKRGEKVNNNHMTIQWNLALAYERLGQRSLALNHFMRFLQMSDKSGRSTVDAQKVRLHLKQKYGVNVGRLN